MVPSDIRSRYSLPAKRYSRRGAFSSSDQVTDVVRGIATETEILCRYPDPPGKATRATSAAVAGYRGRSHPVDRGDRSPGENLRERERALVQSRKLSDVFSEYIVELVRLDYPDVFEPPVED